MTFSASPLAHTFTSGLNGGTSAGIDTTGANLITISLGWYSGVTANPTVSDINGNLYTPCTKISDSTPFSEQLFYVYAPTVGPGHTFAVSGSIIAAAMLVSAWSGAASSPLDQQSQGSHSGTSGTVQPGSITPSQNDELLITGLMVGNPGGVEVVSINGGFSITDTVAFSGSVNEGGSMAYLVQTTATAANPTWDDGNPGGSTLGLLAAIASFKSGGGPPPATNSGRFFAMF